ncbi:MAG: hypothetical protein QM661_15100 [Solimonas sp.]
MADAQTFAARFNQALDELPARQRPPHKGAGRQNFVAQMFHISQKGARKWLEGEAMPRLSRIPQIATRCGVNGEWLLTGQGPMRPDESTAGTGEPDRIREALPIYNAQPRTLRLIRRMHEAEQAGRLSEADIAAIEGVVLRLIER